MDMYGYYKLAIFQINISTDQWDAIILTQMLLAGKDLLEICKLFYFQHDYGT